MVRRLALVSFLLLPLAACGHTTDAGKPADTAAAGTVAASTAPAEPSPESTSAPVTPTATAASDQLTGTQYAYLKAADTTKGTITFDLVEWFEGKAAANACKADGVEPAENDWCTGWYIRNNNKKLRTYPVAPGAKLRVVETTGTSLVAADLKDFRTRLLETGRVFVFTVAAGQITKADEIYTP
ncbi:hypothetical protein [Actinoplanes regularis]|uniref:Lipoprotein n=1 Tax=Actinoplanes regularis TaxID=52697 RepID=A0A239BMF7_9ACTN|nr:hypothetical protein [Actinoplanes regularis]GIE88409.1 hypothetical protein Are01nite_48890 [Actinoplanes regularis]SNS09150.1 hypothetical protein SAMN06264365_11012 [Actinoplanes regularis]